MSMNPHQAGSRDGSSSSVTSGLSPSTIAGLVLIPLGVWAALEPFLFGGWAWEWHSGRFLLTVFPGAAAALGGAIMLSGRRSAVSLGGGLALAAGLWFIVGPAMYGLWVGHELGTLAGGESVRLLQLMPFFFGAGTLVSLLSSYGLGLLAPLQFDEEMQTEPVRQRARVPLPPERPRRKRGEKDPARQGARPHTRAKGPTQRGG